MKTTFRLGITEFLALLDKNPEVELEIKDYVINDLMKNRFLKAIEHNISFIELKENLDQVAKREIAEKIGTFSREWGETKINPSQDFRRQIDYAVDNSIRYLVKELTDKAAKDMKDKIGEMVKCSIDKKIKSIIEEEVQHRINSVLEQFKG